VSGDWQSSDGKIEKAEPVPAGLTKNTSALSFLELGLQPGDKIESWKGGTETVTKVYGEPGTEGHVYDTVNDQTGNTSTYGTGGIPSAYMKVPYAPTIPKSKKDDPASLLGEPVTWNGKQGYVKYVMTEGGKSVFGIGSTPGGEGASDIAGNVPVTEVTAGHHAPPIPKKPDTPTPLKPYSKKSKTGGGYVFADLKDLSAGDHFTDKTGKVYVAVGKTMDGYYMKFKGADGSDNNGESFYAPVSTRVKLVGNSAV
jgi:hypothetical protein